MIYLISGIFRYIKFPKKLSNGYKYRLRGRIKVATGIIPIRPYTCEFFAINSIGVLTIMANYAWDGASFICPDHKAIVYPSCVHDAICQLFHLGIITKKGRRDGDRLLGVMVKSEMIRLSSGLSFIGRSFFKLWAPIWSNIVWAAVSSYTTIQ